ncbi:MAG: PAS domain S-box protein [Nitrospirae bacterium]|nr:PAS domain S-box protein [Nitrospirota bacterium]
MKKKSKVSDKHISEPNSEFRIPQSELRKRAEKKLRARTAEKQGLSFKDAQPVIHELQVHQIELEMQNEELRRAQIELEESRRKYSDLYDFAPVGYFTFDKNGLILEVNLTGAALLGLGKSALMEKPFSRFIHREDQDLFYLHLRKVFETKSRQACEISLKTRDNSVFIAQLLSIPVKDIEGNYSRTRTAMINITERKLIEEALYRAHEELEFRVIERTAALRESNELMENIFSNVHVQIVYLDSAFNFIRVNNKYAKSEGREPEFYAGKNYFGLFPDEDDKMIFRKVVETGEPYSAKAKPYAYAGHPEQQIKFRDWSLKPVKEEDGRISGLVLSLIDVTDNIVLYSELMRSEHLASVGRLAAGVAHEVNNPINGIINYAQMLLNKFDTESKEHEITGRIIKESDRIADIVKSLLSFARESKEGKRHVYISEILSDSLALTEIQMRKSGIKLVMNIPPGLPRINAQPQHIEQVFLNLISNACYALNRKYPEAHNDKIIRIFAETVEAGNTQYVRISFYDQGAGIPAGILDKIMDPFFTTKNREGTGLGLSISHGIISDHGGSIKIDSVEGKFTRVVINLPAQK